MMQVLLMPKIEQGNMKDKITATASPHITK